MTTTAHIGKPISRVDGRAKVTGQTRFADDTQDNGRFSFGVVFKFGGK